MFFCRLRREVQRAAARTRPASCIFVPARGRVMRSGDAPASRPGPRIKLGDQLAVRLPVLPSPLPLSAHPSAHWDPFSAGQHRARQAGPWTPACAGVSEIERGLFPGLTRDPGRLAVALFGMHHCRSCSGVNECVAASLPAARISLRPAKSLSRPLDLAAARCTLRGRRQKTPVLTTASPAFRAPPFCRWARSGASAEHCPCEKGRFDVAKRPHPSKRAG